MVAKHIRRLPHLLPIVLSTASLLVLSCLGSSAQEISPEDRRALLPVIPPRHEASRLPLQEGVLRGISGPVPGVPVPDPDDFKVLYGYSGPYYNVVNLNGRVTVLDRSIHTWPTSGWKASGLVRNQTHSVQRIISVTARLLGQQGELLDVANAAVPVDEVRPGEPIPFLIEAPIPRGAVGAIEWRVDSEAAQDTNRMFEIEVYSEQVSAEFGYYLFGAIRNADSISAPARMVAAWLDSEGRVVHVDSLRIASLPGRREPAERGSVIELAAGHFEHFVYATKDPSLVSLLKGARVALWGISR